MERAPSPGRGPILGRPDHRVLLDTEVVEGEGSPRHPFGTGHRLGVAVERRGVRGEDQDPVGDGTDLLDAPLHVGTPQLEITAVLGLPILVEVEQEVGPTLPGAVVGMDGEVGMDIEEPAPGRLVETSSFEGGIGDEIVDAQKVADEGHEARGVELLEDRPQGRSPRRRDRYC